ncbi:hypothetical protein BDR07DRAFT_1457812 [Suillus spraguei]|nr:hypothetical protein BDR07DRAFT_1457812 [Suillus spraguei]
MVHGDESNPNGAIHLAAVMQFFVRKKERPSSSYSVCVRNWSRFMWREFHHYRAPIRRCEVPIELQFKVAGYHCRTSLYRARTCQVRGTHSHSRFMTASPKLASKLKQNWVAFLIHWYNLVTHSLLTTESEFDRVVHKCLRDCGNGHCVRAAYPACDSDDTSNKSQDVQSCVFQAVFKSVVVLIIDYPGPGEPRNTLRLAAHLERNITMKRGFLNTRKAKQCVSEAVDAESTRAPSHKEAKGERPGSGIRIENTDFNTLDPHKLPKIIQQQVDNDKHCVGYGKNRIVFRVWPRDPKGDTIAASSLRGKEASNGIDLWGATLYDFYEVLRAPDVQNYLTISTGSRLAKWMRQHGELIAGDELHWADKEEHPKEMPVVDIGEMIRSYDTRVAFGIFDQFSTRREIREMEKAGWSAFSYSDLEKATDGGDSTPPVDDEGDNIGREQEVQADANETTASAQLDKSISESKGETSPEHSTDHLISESAAPLPDIDSPFHPDHYPSPYPFIPCTHETSTLQQRIPLHLLPQKLHVHDPWNKLTVNQGDSDRNSDHETPWLSKAANGGNIVRTYSLSLTPEGKEIASKAQKLADVAEDEAAKEESVMRIFPTDKEGPTEEPLIEVVLPLRPRKRTQVEEAHLYLAPHIVGSGHHSVVHNIEWELPRDLFFEAYLCKACVEEDVRQQVQKLKDEGEWEALLQDPVAKYEETMQGSPGGGPCKTSVDANDVLSSNGDPPPDTASDAPTTGGAETDVEIDAVDGQDLEPGAKVEQEENSDAGIKVDDHQPGQREGDNGTRGGQCNGDEEKDSKGSRNEPSEEYGEKKTFALEPPAVIRIASYSGPVLRLNTTVKWRSPSEEQCDHERNLGSGPVPRTTIVSVAAKLSIAHDPHLAQEAENYQSFPDHFFQYWTGYNIVPPMHDPVPVGALCPQFYGYYTPDELTDDKHSRLPRYLSPILLLEHCGREIDPDELCLDDKQECASLVLRFHHAGWLHGSFAARNILWQQGKPTEWPLERMGSGKSFRLIDFGRSEKLSETFERLQEGEMVCTNRTLLFLNFGARWKVFKLAKQRRGNLDWVGWRE